MHILPTNPWLNGTCTSLNVNVEQAKWDSEDKVNTSKAHESKESIRGNIAIDRECGFELGTVFTEGNYGEDTVGARNKPDYDGW